MSNPASAPPAGCSLCPRATSHHQIGGVSTSAIAPNQRPYRQPRKMLQGTTNARTNSAVANQVPLITRSVGALLSQARAPATRRQAEPGSTLSPSLGSRPTPTDG